jgi:hypothetical protein
MKNHEWKPWHHINDGSHWELWDHRGRYRGAAYRYGLMWKANPCTTDPVSWFPTLRLAAKYIEECVNENCT